MKSEDQWKAEENARILMRVEEIKGNSREYASAKKILSTQAAAISKVVAPAKKPAARRK